MLCLKTSETEFSDMLCRIPENVNVRYTAAKT